VPSSGGLRPSSPHPRRLAEIALVAGCDAPAQDGDVPVTGVTLDSRRVMPGDLYAALPGSRAHGAQFAAAAAESGAVAVLTDPAGAAAAARVGLPVLQVADPRAVLGPVAAAVYGSPADHLLLLGVTGTNGKTTTTYLLDGALRRTGRLTGLVGTVQTRVAGRGVDSVRTTPEAPDIQALLATMVEAGVTACSMEVSSHALALHRVDGLVFDVAGFTNLSQDHLDFHAGLEDYFATKASLFTPERARRAVVCVDDAWGRRLASASQIPVVTVAGAGVAGADADWVVGRREPRGAATAFTVRHADGRAVDAVCPLPGDFNVLNAALALVMLVEAGLPPDEVAAALREADTVPGRMEVVRGPGRPGEPLAVVDYAHTPDAVAAALAALRPSCAGPLVVVLGAGGERDREKRPRMGEAAGRGADVVVVTDDNPRAEHPGQIRSAVLAGARSTVRGRVPVVLEVADRAAAIAEGVRRAWGGGTVLVAGKGHEQGQDVAGVVHPFDDREVLAQVLAARDAGHRDREESPL
jgi:UDP-N-acetylmuramoyl-L-alanyl-D-glutamate--2,6-diaminopimelate ligase